mmetsp:Transcript_1074/g.2165  ORF Transcript_1074/g.2165 Transcript_1074/m.2165 type:complete len:215 (-) Transcript_1074:1090-1734(-)
MQGGFVEHFLAFSHNDGSSRGVFMRFFWTQLDARKAVGEVCRQKGRGGVTEDKGRVTEDRLDKTRVVLDTFDNVFINGIGEAFDSRETVRSVVNQFTQHGIVVRRDNVSGGNTRIDTNVRFFGILGLARFDVGTERSNRRQVSTQRIFGINTGFDGVSLERHHQLSLASFFDFWWQSPTGTDPEHALDQIHTRDGFGNRVFHLQTRVHFQEIKV